jgi:hypothetical protein
MQEYHQKVQIPALAQAKGRVHTHTIDSLASHFGIKDMGVRRSNPASGTQSPDQEYHAYINGDLWEEHSDPLVFWEVNNNHYAVVPCSISYLFTRGDLQSKCESYPTIFAIAMDYLSIQASSVPSECVFSSSMETDTKKRNQISPTLMEALQMLKYDFRKHRLTFSNARLDQRDLLEDDSDEPELSTAVHSLSQDNAVDAIVGRTIREEGDHILADIALFDF